MAKTYSKKAPSKSYGKVSKEGPSMVQRLIDILDGTAGEVPFEGPADKAARVSDEAVKKKKRNLLSGK